MAQLKTSNEKLKTIKDYDFLYSLQVSFEFILSFGDDIDLTLFDDNFFRFKNDYFLEYRTSNGSKNSKSFKSRLKKSGFYYTEYEISLRGDGDLFINVSYVSNLNVSIDTVIKTIIHSIRSSNIALKNIKYSRKSSNTFVLHPLVSVFKIVDSKKIFKNNNKIAS